MAGLRWPAGKEASTSGSRRNRQVSGSSLRRIRQQTNIMPQGIWNQAHPSLVVGAFFYPHLPPAWHSCTVRLESCAAPVGMQVLWMVFSLEMCPQKVAHRPYSSFLPLEAAYLWLSLACKSSNRRFLGLVHVLKLFNSKLWDKVAGCLRLLQELPALVHLPETVSYIYWPKDIADLKFRFEMYLHWFARIPHEEAWWLQWWGKGKVRWYLLLPHSHSPHTAFFSHLKQTAVLA